MNQIKSLFRRFCSFLNQHTLDSMIIQVMSQEIHIVDSLCNSLQWSDTALPENVYGYRLHNNYCPFPRAPVLRRSFALTMLIPCAAYAVGTPRRQRFNVREKQIQWHKCLTCGFVNYSRHRHQWNSHGDSSVKSGTKPHCQVMNDWNSVVKFPVCCTPWHCGKENELCSRALTTITLVSQVTLSNMAMFG